MFLGHYAVALASKRAAPAVNLGVLILAAQFLDLIWPLFVLAGIEHLRIAPGNTAFTPLDFSYYPWTHSALTAAVWSLGFALVYAAFRREARGAIVVAVAVFSHWVLDFITHRPDLPLAPGSDIKVGLGLWNSVGVSIALELLLWSAGVALYISVTRRRNRRGSIAFWSLVGLLTLIFFANVFGPPPPNVAAVAWSAMLLWLLPLWGWWIDRNRVEVRNRS
jgi:hypothetical protein